MPTELTPWPFFPDAHLAALLSAAVDRYLMDWGRYLHRNPNERMPSQSEAEIVACASLTRDLERIEAQTGTRRQQQILGDMTVTERATFRKAQRESRAEDAVQAEAMARFRTGR